MTLQRIANRPDACTNCIDGIEPGQVTVPAWGGWCHIVCLAKRTLQDPPMHYRQAVEYFATITGNRSRTGSQKSRRRSK